MIDPLGDEPLRVPGIAQEHVHAVVLTREDYVGVLPLAFVLPPGNGEERGLRTRGEHRVEIGVRGPRSP